MADAPLPPPEPELGRPRPARRGYLVPGVIALVVLGLLAVVIDVVGLQHHTPRSLAGPDVATLISQNLQYRNPGQQPPQIRCPPSEPVRVGVRFSCELETANGPRPLDVVITTPEGAFTWTERAAPAG